MDLRLFQPGDRAACLAVFDSNLPGFFHPSERPNFESFLDNAPRSFFVLDHDGAIAGCGGYAFENPDLASICWLIVRRDLQGNGLGRLLVFTAMRKAGAEGDPTMLRLNTTPAIQGFFEKQGFRAVSSVPNGIAPGFDSVEMVKKLKVCA